jgi:hypothetical protein
MTTTTIKLQRASLASAIERLESLLKDEVTVSALKEFHAYAEPNGGDKLSDDGYGAIVDLQSAIATMMNETDHLEALRDNVCGGFVNGVNVAAGTIRIVHDGPLGYAIIDSANFSPRHHTIFIDTED